MPTPRLIAEPTTAELEAGFAAVRAELEVPPSYPAVEPVPPPAIPGRVDRTDLPMVTIDPPGSRDLDQAFFIERDGDGYRVWYAIADVAAFVSAGDPVDVEAHRRGVTLYSPDERATLYPAGISEGGASLLPDEDRPAVLYQFDLDASGAVVRTTVGRATVRSRAQLDYASVDASEDEPKPLLREVGQLRQAIEVARGGVNLNLPDQQIMAVDGGYRLAYRAPLAVEDWNAQLSLLCGMEAARIMLAGGVGLLRTLPPAPGKIVRAVRRSARVLGFEWPEDMPYATFVRGLDRTTAAGAALVHQAGRALRGAGYRAFGPGDPPPVDATHATVAAPYAHVTAPLRRLADRYANEVVLALVAGETPPAWATRELPTLRRVMVRCRQREQGLSTALVDYMETMVLRSSVGSSFPVAVTDIDKRGAVIQLRDPAVLARMPADGRRLGEELTVRLSSVDPVARQVVFGSVEADG